MQNNVIVIVAVEGSKTLYISSHSHTQTLSTKKKES